jgi:hypothetical protein
MVFEKVLIQVTSLESISYPLQSQKQAGTGQMK